MPLAVAALQQLARIGDKQLAQQSLTFSLSQSTFSLFSHNQVTKQILHLVFAAMHKVVAELLLLLLAVNTPTVAAMFFCNGSQMTCADAHSHTISMSGLSSRLNLNTF